MTLSVDTLLPAVLAFTTGIVTGFECVSCLPSLCLQCLFLFFLSHSDISPERCTSYRTLCYVAWGRERWEIWGFAVEKARQTKEAGVARQPWKDVVGGTSNMPGDAGPATVTSPPEGTQEAQQARLASCSQAL